MSFSDRKFLTKNLTINVNLFGKIWLPLLNKFRKEELTNLTFGDNFNVPIPYNAFFGLINLKSLTFGDKFNKDIYSLYGLINLESLTLENSFNEPIDALYKLSIIIKN